MEVLICSHDPMLVKELKNPLRDSGHIVTTVSHAAQAIKLMLHNQFNAAIIDAGIFGLSASETLPVIRRISPATRIIIAGDAPFEQDVWTVSKPTALEEIKSILNINIKERE